MTRPAQAPGPDEMLLTNSRSVADQRDTSLADDMACFDQLPTPIRRVINDSCCAIAARSVYEQWVAYRNAPGFSLERFVVQFCLFDEESERNAQALWGFAHTEPFQHPLLKVLRTLKESQ